MCEKGYEYMNDAFPPELGVCCVFFVLLGMIHEWEAF